MGRTSTRVSFGLFDLVLKASSSLACLDTQPFTQLSDLRNDNTSPRPYASYEPDYWLLDGQYKFLPPAPYTTVHIGLVSLSMSDADGAFAVPPVLEVSFGQLHDTSSLSLVFAPVSGDYASSVTIAFYHGAALLRSDTYTPSAPEFYTGQEVTAFDKIVITFHATSRPYRYARVAALNYGELVTFAGVSVKAASLIEEINQLSTELPFNTLDLSLYSADAQFSLINPTGKYTSLSEGQTLDVYEAVDGVESYIGRFYLEEWENSSDTDYHFRASDILGMLDGQIYTGGIWPDGVLLETLVESILTPVNVPYELNSTLIGTPVRGWLSRSSYRRALQQIGFAVGAAVTCARSGVIRFTQTKLPGQHLAETHVSRAQKGLEQALTLKHLVTGVSVTSHTYAPCGESIILASGQYQPGVYEISFGEPIYALAVSGATILQNGVNYAILSVPSFGTVVLTGLKYNDTTAIVTITTPNLPANVRPNILKVEDATLIDSGNVGAVAQRLYDYSQARFLQKTKLFAPPESPGSVVVIDTLYGRKLHGVIERMDTDLTGGYTSKVELTGIDYVD